MALNERVLKELVPGLTVGEADRHGRRLRFLIAGEGDPAILLVAGAGETALDWLPILPGLASVSTVVAVDRAGLGLSDPAPGPTAQMQVDDLAAVLAQIGPAVLVGHSWGGLLVQLVAWQQPGSVAGLVLVDPSHEELTALMPLRLRAASAAFGPALMLAYTVGLFPRLARPPARKLAGLCTPDARLQAAIEEAYLASYRRRQVRLIGKENRLGTTSRDAIRRARAGARPIEAPLVVLTATAGKAPAMQRRSTALHAEVAVAATRGRQIVVENAGHYIHHDRPDAVLDAVAGILADIPRP